jgi:hypothetical protein
MLPVIFVFATDTILSEVIVLLPKLLADKPLARFAENIVAPVFARNEILLSESVLIDDTTI